MFSVKRSECVYYFYVQYVSQTSLLVWFCSGRFMTLLDSMLHYMIPAWDHSLGTFNQIKVSTLGF